jgi:hypothetical protein
LSEEQDLLIEFLDRLARSRRRLQWLRQQLATTIPVTPASLETMPEPTLTMFEALLKKLEQLIDDFRRVTRTVLIVAGEPPIGLNQRQMLDRLESLGAIASAERVIELIKLRNRTAHEYPTDPVRQAKLLNETYDAVASCGAMLDELLAYAERVGLLPALAIDQLRRV